MSNKINEHREHRYADAKHGKEIYQSRDDRKYDSVFTEPGCQKYHERFDGRNNEQCKITAQNAEDQERQFVEEHENPVAEFPVRSVLDEELQYSGAVIYEVESA